MTAEPPVQPQPRRWPRIRYSLRTLLILVLLAGSGMGLWFRWEPWEIVGEDIYGKEQFKNLSCTSFSPDQTRFVTFNLGSKCDILIFSVKKSEPDPLWYLKTDFEVFRVQFVNNDRIVVLKREGCPNNLNLLSLSRRRPEYWWGIAWLPESLAGARLRLRAGLERLAGQANVCDNGETELANP